MVPTSHYTFSRRKEGVLFLENIRIFPRKELCCNLPLQWNKAIFTPSSLPLQHSEENPDLYIIFCRMDNITLLVSVPYHIHTSFIHIFIIPWNAYSYHNRYIDTTSISCCGWLFVRSWLFRFRLLILDCNCLGEDDDDLFAGLQRLPSGQALVWVKVFCADSGWPSQSLPFS